MIRTMRPALLGALLLALLPASAGAIHRETPFMVNLSSYLFPGIAGDSCCVNAQGESPRWSVFESSTDLMGNGSTGREIFIFDLQVPRSLGQVTNFNGDSNRPTVNQGGTFVAFDSAADIKNTGSTARQIFLWNRKFASFSQLTFGTLDSTRPNLNNEGTFVTFQSDADLVGNGSTGTNVFYWASKPVCDLDGCHRLVQVTNFAGISQNPKFSPDAESTYILFESNAPLLGFSNGALQIFLYDRREKEFIQLTAAGADCHNATIDETGRMVAYETGGDIYLLDRETGLTRQVTTGGGSYKPWLGSNAQFLIFVSTADLLGTGTPPGQHLFVYDPRSALTFQVTKAATGSSDNPVATGNTIFFFDSDEDPMKNGAVGRHTYALNIFNKVPPAAIGGHNFQLEPGTATGGSQVQLNSAGGAFVAPIAGGVIPLSVGGRDFDGEAPVEVRGEKVVLPPIPIPGFGALCLRATGDGEGVLDCDGGRADADVTVNQDHNTDDSDPLCILGCREGTACQGELKGPHQTACPICLDLGNGAGPVCTAGLFVGQPCNDDRTCKPNDQCIDGALGVCTGPVDTDVSGTFTPGGMQFTLPMATSLVTERGVDGVYCTADDVYKVHDVPTMLRFTTGNGSGTITDVDNVPGGLLTATGTGAPFICNDLQNDKMTGAAFVGHLTYLDVPDVPGLADVLVSLRFAAKAGPPCIVNCPQSCNTDAQCADTNPCNGAERCINNTCVAGTPVICSDGNACNGTETCDPGTGGCLPGTAPVCDDGNPCNGVETCDTVSGCTAGTPIVCSDSNACNGEETCDPGTGTCLPGTAPLCDDANPCNGVESCDVTLGCVAGTPLCDDGNACNGVETCDPGTGTCGPGTAPVCDDANPCNGVESCDPGLGCVPGTPIACGDGNACNGDEVCDPGTGTCGPGTPLVCDDGNPCNGVEACVPASGCVPGIPPECSDGDACNGTETCDPGTGGCLPGTPLTCDDGDACNGVETCAPATGCVAGIAVVCGDGDACNGTETCDPGTGTCLPGTPLDCNDNVACTLDSCDPALGCQNNLPVGSDTVGCLLAELRAALAEPPDGAFTRRRLPRRLRKIVERTYTTVETADVSNHALSIQLFGKAQKRLGQFVRIVKNADRRDRIEALYAVRLVSIARGAMTAMQPLISG